jgi:hypothetical protein
MIQPVKIALISYINERVDQACPISTRRRDNAIFAGLVAHDMITLYVAAQSLHLYVDDAEFAR